MLRAKPAALLIALLASGLSSTAAAQEPARGRGAAPPRVARPPLFFREEWKQTAAGGEHPVNPAEALSNPNLELKLYGKEILLTGSAQDENNPIHLWTGTCTTPCAVALRDKTNYGDLTGLARIRWTTKVSGFHQVRPIVKLADGTWLVGDHTDGSTLDWLQSDFLLADVRWLRLDIASVVTKGTIVEKPDLGKVDEIGFVDLMPGSGHGPGGWIDVAAIEVFGKPVKR
ncbi:MAG TPA: hypothetical protein VKD69_13980 [Vicinamibacterales bacterium]|nr:hypothetical protein [Vicinamibacterales bacterium]